VKKFDYTKNTGHGRGSSEARTLCPSFIGNNKSGWNIKGEVHEDYYEWVNYFVANHPIYGVIKGDFEGFILASSQALKHFLEHHHFEVWDYYDI